MVNADTIEPGAVVDQTLADSSEAGLLLSEQNISPIVSKKVIRRSLRASTWDGMFATIFSNVTGGVLLSNFLVELHATPTQVGMLSSIPMLANFIQPIGALLGDRTNSRHNYCLWIYGPSRLLWLVLAIGIVFMRWHRAEPSLLVQWTLAIVLISNFFWCVRQCVLAELVSGPGAPSVTRTIFWRSEWCCQLYKPSMRAAIGLGCRNIPRRLYPRVWSNFDSRCCNRTN